jgi:hypothetical protein
LRGAKKTPVFFFSPQNFKSAKPLNLRQYLGWFGTHVSVLALPMKLLSWNINSLPPTTANVVLKHGSLETFFSKLELDLVCLQVQ